MALCVVDFSRAPSDDLAEGDVAPHTVTAPFTFSYTDHERYEAARDEARRSTPPVFVHQADLVDQRIERVLAAFTAGRSTLDAASGENSTDSVSAAVTAFQRELPVQVSADDARKLALAGFSPGAERLTRDLLDRSMRDRLVLLSRDQLPADRRPVTVIHLEGGERREVALADYDLIIVPERARELISVAAMEARDTDTSDAAAAVARAMVSANLSYDPLTTAERQELAAVSVPVEARQIKRGAILFRAGDVLSAADVALYAELRSQSDRDVWVELAAVVAFLTLLYASVHHFAHQDLPGLSNKDRDVVAAAALTALAAAFARVVTASGEGIAALIGYGAEPQSIWFLVPVAGAVMLARLLMGVAWAVVLTVGSAVA